MSGDRSRERRRLAAERLIFAKQMDDWKIRASVLGMTQRWLDLAQPREPVAFDKALRLQAIQTNIGRELRAQFDLPREMPHRILTLLIQIGAPQDGESGATARGQAESRVPYSKTQCVRARDNSPQDGNLLGDHEFLQKLVHGDAHESFRRTS